MNKILNELRRSWAITVKDMKIYYLRPPALMFGILFPFALFITFTVGRNIPNERLIPIMAAQTVFWSASSIGPVAIPLERRMRTFERYLSAPISLIAVLWGKTLAGVLFGLGITAVSTGIAIFGLGLLVTNPTSLIFGVVLSAMAYSAMGILFASIPTGRPGEVTIPLNLVRIPLMFSSGLFIPLEQMPLAGIYTAFLSPLTHTLDLLKLAMGGVSYFGWATNIGVLTGWMVIFLFIGQMLHRIIMKKE